MKKIIFHTTLFLSLCITAAACQKNKEKSADSLVLVEDSPPQQVTAITELDFFNYKQFASRNLKASATPFTFSQNTANQDNLLAKQLTLVNGSNVTVDNYLKSSATIAFVVIKNDQIIAEKYYPNGANNFEASSVGTSFSVAKSWVSALIGIAIGEGKIKAVSEPITNYLPELKNGKGFERITIKHLLNMASGIKFNEGATADSDLGQLYTTADILTFVKGLSIESVPQLDRFKYQSINTQLLGIILARATQGSVTQYLQDKIWTPIGMEFAASWSLDKVGGMEKTFCCLNARARDYAKFGRLFLNKGNWQGKQLIPESWVSSSTAADPAGASYYNNQWWFPKESSSDLTTDFTAIGALGQFIYISPAKNIIIVKLSNVKLAGDDGSMGPMRQIAEKF